MRGAIMLGLALLAVLAALVGANADTSLAICKFQGSSTVTGWLLFEQAVEGGDVVITSNFTSSVAVEGLYLHIHDFGDLDTTSSCFTNDTYGPWVSDDVDTHFTDSRTVVGFSLSGEQSIVGRSVHFYESVSSCPTGVDSSAVASCVVGIRNVAISELFDTNAASQVLSADPVSAHVSFVGGSAAPELSGEAWFVPTASGLVYVKVDVTGLAASTVHAVHVHTYGDIHLASGLSAGLHLNPAHVNHGYPPSPHRHMGDLGNFTTSDGGVMSGFGLFDLLSFTASSGNIIGRGMIIHALGDDGNPLNLNTSTGAAGGRLGMGVVGISSRLPDGFVDPSSEGDAASKWTAADFVAPKAATTITAASSPKDAKAASVKAKRALRRVAAAARSARQAARRAARGQQ